MQYVQSPAWKVIQRYFVAFVAVVMSIVIATSIPVKALTIHQALIGTTETIKTSLIKTLDATVAALEKNEKDMAALGAKLQANANYVVSQTREEINKFVAGAEKVRDLAKKLAEDAVNVTVKNLKSSVDTIANGLTTGAAGAIAALDGVIAGVDNLVKTGETIVAEAQKIVDQGKAELDALVANVQKFTEEQLANLKVEINKRVAAAQDTVNKVGALVSTGASLIAGGVKAAGTAAVEQFKAAEKLLKDFAAAGQQAVTKAVAQLETGSVMLKEKIESDLRKVKEAVKVSATENGVSAEINLGSGLVIYAGIELPAGVAESLRHANEQRIAKMKEIKAQLLAATDPTAIREKIQDAVKQVNDAALASVFTRTTKAIDSQITVVEGLQVSANALQTQANQLAQCLQQSSASEECQKLRTNENSADQGASLQERISEIRTNLETLRAFLSATVDLAVILNDENYAGTIASMTSMTNMMHSMSSLTSGTRNDLKNLSNAINV